jgi:hypothetical protein
MKLNKTLFFSAAVFAAISVSSCKKDKITVAASLTADIDGTATNFSSTPVALTGSVNNEPFTVIQGATPAGALISITLSGTLTAGKTYSDAAANDADKPLFIYDTSSTADDFVNDDSKASNVPSVTITSITSTTIDGTFKGALVQGVQVGNVQLPTKAVTNGKFHVNIVSHQ